MLGGWPRSTGVAAAGGSAGHRGGRGGGAGRGARVDPAGQIGTEAGLVARRAADVAGARAALHHGVATGHITLAPNIAGLGRGAADGGVTTALRAAAHATVEAGGAIDEIGLASIDPEAVDDAGGAAFDAAAGAGGRAHAAGGRRGDATARAGAGGVAEGAGGAFAVGVGAGHDVAASAVARARVGPVATLAATITGAIAAETIGAAAARAFGAGGAAGSEGLVAAHPGAGAGARSVAGVRAVALSVGITSRRDESAGAVCTAGLGGRAGDAGRVAGGVAANPVDAVAIEAFLGARAALTVGLLR